MHEDSERFENRHGSNARFEREPKRGKNMRGASIRKNLGTPVPRTCAPPVARLVGVRFTNRFFVTRILQRAAFIRSRLVAIPCL